MKKARAMGVNGGAPVPVDDVIPFAPASRAVEVPPR